MNILLIGHESDLNGASKSLINIADVLEKKHSVYVLTAFNSGAFYNELKKHNVKIIYYPFFRWCVARTTKKNWVKRVVKWNFYEKFVNELSACRIARIVKKNGIEIIHTNSSVVNIGALIKKYTGVKHIWHIREFGDLDFQMYPLLKKRRFYRFMNRYTDYFICISKAISEHYDHLSNEKKRIIYNGIDADYHIQREIGQHSCVNFLIAGRISRAKGQIYAVKACKRLVDSGVTDFHLYIAGAGHLDTELKGRVKNHITLLGLVENINEIRKGMDVELVCSEAEAFGRVTAEAMMGGIPVIGSNTGGTVELIKDGETGFLYEHKNVEDLAGKMQFMIENGQARNDMGEKARKYAEKNFTIDRCVSEIVKLYED